VRLRRSVAVAAEPSEDVPTRGSKAFRRLKALIRKEFLQLRRDPRTLALMVFSPVMLMLVFGYAASFDVKHIRAELVGTQSQALRSALEKNDAFDVAGQVADDEAAAEDDIQHGRVVVAIEVDPRGVPTQVLVDGSRLMEALTVERSLIALQAEASGGAQIPVRMLYNPLLRSADFMIPGLIGQIMVQVGVVFTALGIVRERERGTMEQLLITPLGRLELMVGKVLPYLAIAFLDLVVVVAVARFLFHVTIAGSLLLLLAGSAVFLASTLGIGLMISTVAQNQQQALQMSVFIQLPQILLSGWIFPLAAIPWAIRWISYLLPLTYYLPIARGIFLKGSGLQDLWPNLVVLAVMAVVYLSIATLRFRRSLD